MTKSALVANRGAIVPSNKSKWLWQRLDVLESRTGKSVGLAQLALIFTVLDFSLSDNPFFGTGRIFYVALFCALASLIMCRGSLAYAGRIGFPLLALFWWEAASLLWTHSSSGTYDSIKLQMVVFFTLWALAATKDVVYLVLGIVASGYIFFLVAGVSLVTDFRRSTTPQGATPPGFHGWAGEKNQFGMVCMMFTLVFLCDTVRTGRRIPVVVGFGLLLFSQSSTSLACFFAGAACFALRRMIQNRSRTGIRALLIGSVCGACALLLSGRLDITTGAAVLGREGTLTGRTAIWDGVWQLIQRRPINGFGFGGVWGPGNSLSQFVSRIAGFTAPHAHSAYLDLTVQTGVVGLSLYLLAIGRLFRAGQLRGGSSSLIAVSLGAAIAVSSVSESLVVIRTMQIFLGLASLAVGMAASSGAVPPEIRLKNDELGVRTRSGVVAVV